jgi:putative aldouronate transport system substrate-binding protein
MKKRVIALCLAIVMMFGLVTGCKAKDESQKTGTEVTDKTKDDTTVGEKEPAATEKTVIVKWCVFGDKAQDHDLVMEDLNKKLKEKINVELDLEVISQGEYNDKMKLASTAGEDFDLVFTANWLNSFDENMSRDAFMPLNKLVEEYGKDMKAAIPDWLLDVAKVEGELFAIPNQQIIARQLGVVIQKEYADKYGFDKKSLTDIRELEPFLDEIVKNEPTMFPIDKRVEAVTEKGYEGLASESAFIKKDDPDAKLIPATEVIAEQLKLDNEWYQKGYIRKDITTVTDNSADVKANRYVCSLSSYKPGQDAEFTSRQGVEYISVPIEGTYIKATSGIETMTAINVNSKNAEAAMKLLNLVYTDKEIFNELLFGLEGTHYTKTGENSAEPVAESKYNYSAFAWKLGNQFNAWYLPGQADGIWEATDKLNNEAQISVLRGFTFNPTNVQAELAQVAAVNKEYKNTQFTTNDIDGHIADYFEKLDRAGLPNIVKEVQTQIDAWKNK